MYRKLVKWFSKKKKKNPRANTDTPNFEEAHKHEIHHPIPESPTRGKQEIVYPSRTRSFRNILKEPVYAVQAQAICDNHVPKDPQALSFVKGDIITVLEQPEDGRWKGIIFGDRKKGGSRSGYFPASAVFLLGKSERRSLGSGKMKKVLPPTVPDLNIKPPQQRNSAASSGYSSASSGSSSDNRSSLGSDSFPLPPSPVSLTPVPLEAADTIGWAVREGGGPRGPKYPTPTCCSCVSTHSTSSTYKARNPYMAPTYVKIPSPVDSGLDLLQMPSEDSPDAIEPCRQSMTSLDSGRASGGYWEGGHSSQSSHSSHSSPRASASYSSSTASTLSLEERVTESDVRKLLVEQGVPDDEVLLMWLKGLHLPHLTSLFVHAGYDLPTIALMSPQDLAAVGVSDPSARKRLKEKIGRLRLPDPVPDYIPETLGEWLRALNLLEYGHCLESQGYYRVEDVTDLTWEDLEDIGITKLGHQKKIMLAIKRVSDILSGKRIPRGHRSREQPHVQEVLITPHHPHTPLPPTLGGSVGDSVDNCGGLEMQTFRRCFLNQTPVGHYATLRPVRRRRSSDTPHPSDDSSQWPIHLVDPDPLRCCRYNVFNSNGTLPRRKPIAKIAATPAVKSVEDKYDLMCSEDLKNGKITPYFQLEYNTNPKFQKSMSVPSDPLLDQHKQQYERSKSFSSYGFCKNTWNSESDILPPPPPPEDTHAHVEEFPPPPSQADLEKLGGAGDDEPTEEQSLLNHQQSPAFAEDLNSCSSSSSSSSSSNTSRTNNSSNRSCNSNITRQKSFDDHVAHSNRAAAVVEPTRRSSDTPPRMAELSSHPLFRQRRHDSTASNKSSSSTDSCDSLPFAKENVGTLKSKSKSGDSSPTNGLPPVSPRLPSACSRTTADLKVNARRENASSKGGDCVLEEIGSMLSDLSSELDAMIVVEQRKETHV